MVERVISRQERVPPPSLAYRLGAIQALQSHITSKSQNRIELNEPGATSRTTAASAKKSTKRSCDTSTNSPHPSHQSPLPSPPLRPPKADLTSTIHAKRLANRNVAGQPCARTSSAHPCPASCTPHFCMGCCCFKFAGASLAAAREGPLDLRRALVRLLTFRVKGLG